MSRKERREALVPTRIHTKFLYQDHQKLPVEIKEESDGRTIAVIQLEWYASTKAKDGSGDVVKPEWINLSRFESGNAPLKAMHGRGVLSNIGVILEARKDADWLYIKAEARLDITKDNNGRPINEHDYVLYDRLMNRTINWFSIGFSNFVEKYDRDIGANVIESMTLHEISVVDIPDNPLTIIKMLEILHDENSLPSQNNMKPKKTLEEEQKEVPGSEEDTEQKDLMGENSLDDMLRDAVKEQLWVENWVYVVDVFRFDFVYNYYYQDANGDWFDKYYRNTYSANGSSVIIGGEPVEVESKRYRVDKAKFLKSLDGNGQESEDNWNVTTDDVEPESNGDTQGDEGEKAALEIKSKELEQKSLEVDTLTKQLDETNTELEATKEMLKEAQDIAQWAFDQYKALRDEMTEEIKSLKKAKQEHWLSLTWDGTTDKQGNVQKALKDGFKMLS